MNDRGPTPSPLNSAAGGGTRGFVRQFLQRDAQPSVQFMKYAIAGGIATLIDMAVFFLFAAKVFPALKADEFLVQRLHLHVVAAAAAVRARHYVYCKIAAFFVSNTTAYLIDRAWVFHPGRHRRGAEYGLFFLVSLTSFLLGTALAWGLIHILGAATLSAYLANAVASLSVNFAGRKFFVFLK